MEKLRRSHWVKLFFIMCLLVQGLLLFPHHHHSGIDCGLFQHMALPDNVITTLAIFLSIARTTVAATTTTAMHKFLAAIKVP